METRNIKGRSVTKFIDQHGKECMLITLPSLDDLIRIGYNLDPIIISKDQASKIGKILMTLGRNEEDHMCDCDEIDCEGCR